MRGSKYGDRLSGDATGNILEGNQGYDNCSAVEATTCSSGVPATTAVGPQGADRFDYNAIEESTREARDIIRDFHHAEGDLIELADIDANTMVAGDQAFAFIATSAFTGIAGELRYKTAGGNATIFGDVNGDSLADFAVALDTVTSLVVGDFIV